ncbi:hypothetical protein [Butyrivibrio sp. NC2007]|uniref:hypothetical protein n=1 Tax=Butyrivibrio sp. NC2007 TaxID=1280683 RepID=UPI0012DEA188|nr:hypothetical protein [Butyrivibrio sp. NC2007]
MHHTELGEAIKQITFERKTYLGVVKVYGLRNKEYLLENVQGLQIGDWVTLYRKYNSESPDCTAVASAFPDDGSSIRVHTLAGLCLGYIQPPERYVMAELMKAGKHLYAKVHSLNVDMPMEELDTQKAVTLDLYWMEESKPLNLANTFEIGETKGEVMEKNGNAIWLAYSFPDRNSKYLDGISEAIDQMEVNDHLRLIKRATEDNPWAIEVWSDDKKRFYGHMDSRDTKILSHMLDAGKHVYGVVRNRQRSELPHLLHYDFDIYVEDK